ncbi:hypothetical protein E2C01_069548 [Portunus trituberculatus]|uniref:Uncharacterized protein n=1 Tax=Portunus trituberculatus TaxID=210409 RepID=A0A5B7I335_PORTR|nr:hypothetical protein [Portunus trituberculatus]
MEARGFGGAQQAAGRLCDLGLICSSGAEKIEMRQVIASAGENVTGEGGETGSRNTYRPKCCNINGVVNL